jgi:hypothetical protein
LIEVIDKRMRYLVKSLFGLGLSLILCTHSVWAVTGKPPQSKVKPATLVSKPVLDPIQLLESYLLPKNTTYNIADWGVGKASPIKWETPGIVWVEDMTNSYGFLRKGHIPDWAVTLYGPRAGVARVQMISPKPFQLRNALAQHHVQYKIWGCIPTGHLLYITAPGKQPAYLYSKNDNELHLWPSSEFAETKDFQTAGIKTISPPNQCRY